MWWLSLVNANYLLYKMPNVIILLLELLGLSLLLRRELGVPLSVAPPAVASLLTLILYVADFFGGLRYASWFLHFLGLAYLIYTAWRNKKHLLGSESSGWKQYPDIIPAGLLAIFSIFLFQLNRDGGFSAWDEFSHWGLVIRAVSLAHTFHFDTTPLYFQDYPPGMALFSYHVLSLIGYSEGNAYYSVALLLMCFIVPLLAAARQAGPAYASFSVAALLCSIYWRGSGLAGVLIDQVLSVLFAGSVIAYFQLRFQSKSIFIVSFLLCTLALAKHAGQPFALLAAGIMLFDSLYTRLILRESTPGPASRKYYRNILGFLALTSLVALPIIVTASWNQYVSSSGLSQSVGSNSVLSLAEKSLRCCQTPREVEVAGRYFTSFLGLPAPSTNEVRPLYGYAAEAIKQVSVKQFIFEGRGFGAGKAWVLLSLLGVVVACLMPSWRARLRFGILSIMMSSGALVYSFSLLLFYLYGMPEYEARQLSSFERFQDVMLLGWVIILLFVGGKFFEGIASPGIEKKERRIRKDVMAILVISVLFWAVAPGKLRKFIMYGAPRISAEREQIRDWALAVSKKISEKSRVFVVWQGSNGRELWIVRYELLPRPANYNCFSLGRRFSPEDIYTCDLRVSEISGLLSDYDYIAVGKGGRSLREQYGELFDGPPSEADQALYKILKSSDGVRLQHVPLL